MLKNTICHNSECMYNKVDSKLCTKEHIIDGHKDQTYHYTDREVSWCSEFRTNIESPKITEARLTQPGTPIVGFTKGHKKWKIKITG